MSVKLEKGLFSIPDCPGYFFHKRQNKVYSIKSGILKEIKSVSKAFLKNPRMRNAHGKIWCLSNKGKKKYVFALDLKDLDEGVIIRPYQYDFHYMMEDGKKIKNEKKKRKRNSKIVDRGILE